MFGLKKRQFMVEGEENIQLQGTVFPTKKPKAVLVVAHGMAEHHKRYFSFAEFLSENNYSVYLYDHRGHGETASEPESYGFFSEKDGWQKVVDEFKKVVDFARAENPETPLFVMGHSMGSLVVRCFINENSNEIDGAILCGTPTVPAWLAKIGRTLATIIIKKIGAKKHSPLLEGLSLGSFNTKFKPARTPYDWISSDEDQVNLYIEDSKCGFHCSSSFYRDLYSLVIESLNPKAIAKVSKSLPIFFIAGDKDPCGNMGKGVLKLYRKYKKNKIEDVNIKLYENGRHEILKEIFYREVFEDILNWLMQHSKEGSGKNYVE